MIFINDFIVITHLHLINLNLEEVIVSLIIIYINAVNFQCNIGLNIYFN